MKKILLSIVITMSIFLLGNNVFSQVFEIKALENDYGYLEVQIRETSGTGTPTTSTPIAQISFEIRWANTSTADVEILCSSNHYTIGDGMTTKNNHVGDGLYWRNFVKFAANPVYAASNWIQNEWETLATFKITGAAGTVDFDIAPVGWVPQDLVWTQGSPATAYFPTPNGDVSNYNYPTTVYNYVWTGAQGGPPTNGKKWESTANWSTTCAGDPLPNNSYPYFGQTNAYVFIPSDLSKYPELSTNADGWGWACSKMFIENGAHVTVPDLTTGNPSNPKLYIDGDLTLEGTLTLSPKGHSTITGITTINSAEGIIVQADATGVGSFIDNGITYGGSGTAKVQTFLTGSGVAGTFDFHCVGPTVDNTGTGVELSEFNVVSGQTYAYKYNEPTNTWDNYSGLTDPVPTAKGIGLSTNDGSTNIMSMIGELKTGPVSSEAMTIGGVGNGSYLLSNPYPSSVYWDDLLLNNAADVNDKVYVYDGSNYLAYNTGSGGIFDGYLQVGQGFFVEAIGASPFTFANSDRHHSNSAFYKSDFTNRLDVRVSGNESTDGLLVHFYEGAVSGYEANEDVAKKMSYRETATQFWTVLDNGQQMSINAMPLELLGKGMQSVPMSFVCGATGEYMMSLLDAETFETGTEIWLEDKQVGGDWVSINDNPDYVFTATPDDLEDRFVIHFFGPTGVNEIGIENTIDIYSYRQHAFVRNNTNEVIKQVNIYTLAGELLQNNETVDLKLSKFWVSNNMGYYVVRVITDKNVYTNKVFISK